MKRRDFLAVAAAATVSPAAAAGPSIRLANAIWSVDVDPATLAIFAAPAGSSPTLLSRGLPGRQVDPLVRGTNALSWTWDGHFDVKCTLDGPDLSIRIVARRPGELLLIDQPPAAIGQG